MALLTSAGYIGSVGFTFVVRTGSRAVKLMSGNWLGVWAPSIGSYIRRVFLRGHAKTQVALCNKLSRKSASSTGGGHGSDGPRWRAKSSLCPRRSNLSAEKSVPPYSGSGSGSCVAGSMSKTAMAADAYGSSASRSLAPASIIHNIAIVCIALGDVSSGVGCNTRSLAVWQWLPLQRSAEIFLADTRVDVKFCAELTWGEVEAIDSALYRRGHRHLVLTSWDFRSSL